MYLGSTKAERKTARLTANLTAKAARQDLKADKLDFKQSLQAGRLQIKADTAAAEGAALLTEAESSGKLKRSIPWIIGGVVALGGLALLIHKKRRAARRK